MSDKYYFTYAITDTTTPAFMPPKYMYWRHDTKDDAQEHLQSLRMSTARVIGYTSIKMTAQEFRAKMDNRQ